jgi:hypothetical protein
MAQNVIFRLQCTPWWQNLELHGSNWIVQSTSTSRPFVFLYFGVNRTSHSWEMAQNVIFRLQCTPWWQILELNGSNCIVQYTSTSGPFVSLYFEINRTNHSWDMAQNVIFQLSSAPWWQNLELHGSNCMMQFMSTWWPFVCCWFEENQTKHSWDMAENVISLL